MKRSIIWSLVAVVVAAVGLGVFWFARIPSDPDPPAPPSTADIEAERLMLEHFKIEQDAFQIIVVGVLVGLVAVIIPTIVSTGRADFERYKESREAYSKAKTAVMYLPIGMAARELEAACDLLAEAHVEKHVAESYDELERQLKPRGLTTNVWGDNMYDTLDAYKSVIEAHADGWDDAPRSERLGWLRAATPNVKT